MSVIDYSKWDRFADDQSSSDEEDPRPHVTRLDQPSRIVTNGQGVISVNPPVATAVAKQSSSTSNSPDAIPSAWTEKGGTCNLNDHVLYWSQERHSVTFRIPVAHKFRKWQVDVTNILSFSQRHCSTSSDEMKLRIEAGNSETEYWACGTLPHPGHLPEEGEVDWCIEPHANKKYFILVKEIHRKLNNVRRFLIL